jgi:hypothetical protein
MNDEMNKAFSEVAVSVVERLLEDISIIDHERKRLQKENAELNKENEKLLEFNRNQSAMIMVLQNTTHHKNSGKQDLRGIDHYCDYASSYAINA